MFGRTCMVVWKRVWRVVLVAAVVVGVLLPVRHASRHDRSYGTLTAGGATEDYSTYSDRISPTFCPPDSPDTNHWQRQSVFVNCLRFMAQRVSSDNVLLKGNRQGKVLTCVYSFSLPVARLKACLTTYQH